MAHTCINALYHCVFSTKDRRKIITPEIRPQLWAYLGGIAREISTHALLVGGTDDHVHLLLQLPAVMSIAKAMQEIKGGSSKWVHESHLPDFAWQSGYGAFTIGASQKQATLAYITNQAEHHKKATFKQEFLGFLRKNGVKYDLRFIWG
jgi:REP element-mobilizing transposase RayT